MTTIIPPATDEALATIAEAAKQYVEHCANGRSEGEDLYAANITAWMGERMPYILARLGAAEAENEQLRTAPAQATAEPARPSPDHSAVYLDGDRQVWSDYLTVPPGDEVLPMVWACERTQSKSDLAEQGVELRVIGWIQ